jgi:hypothetical protein
MQKLLLILICSLVITSSCRKPKDEEDPKDAPFEFLSEWGELGTADNQLNQPEKLVVASDHIFIYDRGNKKIKKFTPSGNFVAAISSKESFYIFGNSLFAIDFDNDSIINKYNLNLENIANYKLPEPLRWFDDIAGNDQSALITTGGTEEPFLKKIDYTNLTTQDFGKLGTGNLQFKWNGKFAVDFSNNKYYITDGNNRIQVLNKNYQFEGSIATYSQANGFLNSPETVAVSSEYIVFAASHNSSDAIMFYNPTDLSFMYRLNVNGPFKRSLDIEGDKLFILADSPLKVMIYQKK